MRITNRNFVHLIAPGLFLMLFSPRTLLAMPHEGIGPDGSIGARRSLASVQKVRIVGELSCSSTGNVENSDGCTLSIQDSQTGKTYRLDGQNRSAMESFKAGNKKVAVEGTVSGDSVTVERTDVL